MLSICTLNDDCIRGRHEWTDGPCRFPSFATHFSGDKATYDSGMTRDNNAGKPRFDLLAPEGVPYEKQMLTRFAALMARGAENHGDRNWEQADGPADKARFKESAFRHFMGWFCGLTDEDHAVATWFNMMGVEHVDEKMKPPTE